MDEVQYALIVIRRSMYHYLEEKKENKRQEMIDQILAYTDKIIANDAYKALNAFTPREYSCYMWLLRKFDKTKFEFVARSDCKHNWLINA